jgi:hypothetical protein
MVRLRLLLWSAALVVVVGAAGMVMRLGSHPGPGSRTAAATASHRPGPLPFIDDDYAGALSQARARKLPLFIESWAPW